ncbi:MAG: hypothetical protein M0025_00570 [Elusimicrobia bacterium]|nr:hypothetical protein [Elusimicrobiota bacterium]
MKRLIIAVSVLFPAVSAYAVDFRLDQLKLPDLASAAEPQPVPAPAVQKDEVPQELVYRFQQFKNDLSRIENDTTWLRSDISRLESDARRIEQGSSNAFFAGDLRRMKSDMDRRVSDLQRLAFEIKDLQNKAVKDDKLSQLARDIEWDARDLDNRFQFDVLNAAQSLEATVRRIDPKLIGYDAQWNASDLSRACRDIQWKTRDLRWDAQELVRRTQP